MTDEFKLERLVASLGGEWIENPLERAKSEKKLAEYFVEELERARDQCASITFLEGSPVRVTELGMFGTDFVETIQLTFESEGDTFQREYSVQEFYNL